MMLAATIMLADATPTAAATTTPATPAAAAKPAAKTDKADADKVVCKTEAVTGSLFPKKTCRSAKDSAQIQQEERANLEKIQQNSH